MDSSEGNRRYTLKDFSTAQQTVNQCYFSFSAGLIVFVYARLLRHICVSETTKPNCKLHLFWHLFIQMAGCYKLLSIVPLSTYMLSVIFTKTSFLILSPRNSNCFFLVSISAHFDSTFIKPPSYIQTIAFSASFWRTTSLLHASFL